MNSASQSPDDAEIDEDELLMQACFQAEQHFHQSKGKMENERDTKPHESVDKQKKEMLSCLKRYFGHSSFRTLQEKIIAKSLKGEDQLVVMATGYGKSLCYQFPALYLNGLSVVVSPLISLMEDQVMNLKGEYRVLYLTPEFVSADSQLLEKLNAEKRITLVAIDEAHCISQWGHDFRASYRQLGSVRQKLYSVPFIALTATATPAVRSDIVKNLHLKNATVTCTSFDRPNLFFKVLRKNNKPNAELRDLLKFKPNEEAPGFGGSTIVYCPTRKTAEQIHTVLKGLGVRNVLYHAGLSNAAKRAAHKSFSTDKVPVIVGTVAFGMGIDKPDIRNVIHYGAPKDIESYYQEVGRGGRDGLPSNSVVLYSKADFALNSHFIRDIQSLSFRKHKMMMMEKLEEFLVTDECRRRLLLQYFEGKESVVEVCAKKGCCDNCQRALETPVQSSISSKKVDSAERNFGQEAEKMLRVTNEVLCGRFGLGTAVSFLRGTACKVPEHKKQHKLYCCGRDKSEKWWKSFGDMLRQRGYLCQQAVHNGFGFTVYVSSLGNSYLANCDRMGKPVELFLKPTMDLIETEKTTPTHYTPRIVGGPSVDGNLASVVSGPQKILSWKRVRNWETLAELGLCPVNTDAESKHEVELYSEVIELRNRLAEESDVPPYMVAANRVMVELARVRPSALSELYTIEDWSEEKVKKFGPSFLNLIQDFSRRNNLPEIPLCRRGSVKTVEQLPERGAVALKQLTPTVASTYAILLETGKNASEISSFRNLSESTIFNHLGEAAKHGLPLDLNPLGITQEMVTTVLNTVRSPVISSAIGRMAPIKDALPDPRMCSFGQLRIILNILEYEYGHETSVTRETESQSRSNNGNCSKQAENVSSVKISPELDKMTSYISSSSDTPVATNTAETGKRKLPSWMTEGSSVGPPRSLPKKQKSMSSVFR